MLKTALFWVLTHFRTTTRYLMPQKSADLSYFSTEAWNHATFRRCLRSSEERLLWRPRPTVRPSGPAII